MEDAKNDGDLKRCGGEWVVERNAVEGAASES